MLLPPCFQPLVGFFNVRKQPWIFERRPPSRHDSAHPVPHHPDLTVALEEQLVIDQPAIDDARHHVPIADHHTNECVLFASLRIFLHHVFRGLRMEIFNEPRARLPLPRRLPLRWLPQCLAFETPYECAGGVRGTPRPAASALCAPASAVSCRPDRIPARPIGAARRPALATRLRRCATPPPRFPGLAMSFPAARPRPRRYPRTPATSLGSGCLPTSFRRWKGTPARRVRLAQRSAAASVAPRGLRYRPFESCRRLQIGLPLQSESPR